MFFFALSPILPAQVIKDTFITYQRSQNYIYYQRIRSSVGITPSGEFVITWRDYRDGNYNIYARKYNSGYSPDSTDFKVNNELEGLYTTQDHSDVATDGNNIIFICKDAKWQKGWNIAAKVFGWDISGIENVKTEGKELVLLGISGSILMSKEWLMLSVDSPSEVDFDVSKLPSDHTSWLLKKGRESGQKSSGFKMMSYYLLPFL